MEKQIKELYETPAAATVEVKYEGVICASGNANATMDGTWEEEDI